MRELKAFRRVELEPDQR
ncbi:hypothetical protein [Cutibacterium modestum]|nr:hypothetical protein [Cutibacterium modestum]